MKPLLKVLAPNGFITRLSILGVVGSVLMATPAQAARVTQIIRDVKLMPGQAAPRPAVVNDEVKIGSAVRTGTESRTELTFADLTITRLGADTIFSFNEGTRELALGSGAMLVQVPRGGAEVKITTAAVTAGITGGTMLMESHKRSPTKCLVLEGLGRLYPTGHPEEAVIIHGGEMVVMTTDGRITRPTKFKAKLVFTTAKLITDFDPLPNVDLILAVIEEQQLEASNTASTSGGNDSTDVLDLRSNTFPSATTASSAKFGSPSVITAPNPYVINSGTLIGTDPKITTNGKTDSGKIYCGPGIDGSFLRYLGASVTPFDIASGQPNPKDVVPLPVFLFSSLQLDGDPKVSTANGGVPRLALVSQGGITFTPSGTAFTFSGLDNVGLVALKGSIDTSGVSFANFGDLFMEARGAGSDLTLASPISNLSNTHLVAENSMTVTAPVKVSDQFQSFAGNNFDVSSTVTANRIKIQSLGAVNVQSSAQLLAMLNSAGTAGQILLQATGSDTAVTVNGTVQANGEVDIRQTGVAGATVLNTATIHGDVVKISALGTNGTLNIGNGNSISADTVLKLYAGGSNGTLNFQSNVTLTSPTNILSANTINIAQGVIVTISNAANRPADVFTNKANYFGFGGSAPSLATAGTFGGAGAKNPQPLANAPALGPPGGGP